MPRILNPFPEDEVGPWLLVRLLAEEIVEKSGPADQWMQPHMVQMHFQLLSLLAGELGIRILWNDGDRSEQAREQMNAALINKSMSLLHKWISPPAVADGALAESVIPQLVGLLALGLGTKKMPIKDANLTSNAALASEAGRRLKLKVRITEGQIKKAKEKGRKFYAAYKSRQEHRVKIGVVLGESMLGTADEKLVNDLFCEAAKGGRRSLMMLAALALDGLRCRKEIAKASLKEALRASNKGVKKNG
jgi:hypothetical protein